MLDLGPKARIVFAVLYLGGQGALIATAGMRADHAFGFRMFSESTTIEVELFRMLEAPSGHGTTTVHVEDGRWVARDHRGTPHRFSFHDRVRDAALSTFDTRIHASYGADAQLVRLKAALDDVAAHLDDDAETRRLVLDVTVRKNGREPLRVTLESPRR